MRILQKMLRSLNLDGKQTQIINVLFDKEKINPQLWNILHINLLLRLGGSTIFLFQLFS